MTQHRRVAVLVTALILAAAFVAGLSPGTAAAQVATPAIPWDVNGDGYADIGVAAITEDLNAIGNAGIFHLLPGGAGGVTGTGSKAYTQDTAGVPDVAQSGDQFGYAQASGDFNADGFADVAVSANSEDLSTVADSGQVHVFFGSAAGLRTDNSRTFSLNGTAYGARKNAFFGDSLAAGDFNGDGRDDLAIGASGFGRVFWVRGSSSGLGSQLIAFNQDSAGVPGVHKYNDLFGFSLSAGDVNADGRDDLAIGAPWDWDDRDWSTGAVTVLYGSGTGLTGSGSQRWSKDSSGIAGIPGNFTTDWSDSFGIQVALADYNGDGYADLGTSAPGTPIVVSGVKRQDAGTVHLIYGSATKLNSTGNRQLTQATSGVPGTVETGDLFGMTIAGGDADGDGQAELAAFAAGDETVIEIPGDNRFNPITSALAWTQNSTGVAGSTEFGDSFGASLRFALFRGGNQAGLAIGIPGEDGGEGAVEVLYGSGTGLTASGSDYFTQDTAGVPDVAQSGDWFGTFY